MPRGSPAVKNIPSAGGGSQESGDPQSWGGCPQECRGVPTTQRDPSAGGSPEVRNAPRAGGGPRNRGDPQCRGGPGVQGDPRSSVGRCGNAAEPRAVRGSPAPFVCLGAGVRGAALHAGTVGVHCEGGGRCVQEVCNGGTWSSTGCARAVCKGGLHGSGGWGGGGIGARARLRAAARGGVRGAGAARGAGEGGSHEGGGGAHSAGGGEVVQSVAQRVGAVRGGDARCGGGPGGGGGGGDARCQPCAAARTARIPRPHDRISPSAGSPAPAAQRSLPWQQRFFPPLHPSPPIRCGVVVVGGGMQKGRGNP